MSETKAGPAAIGATRSSPNVLRRLVATIGVDNLSLIIALALVVLLIISQQPLFLSWQNLMNSLAQSIVIVGLVSIGETVVIIAGGLDISVGSIASVGSVVSALTLTTGLGFLPTGVMQIALVAGIVAGLLAGVVNGLIITILRVNPIIATLGTLAAYAGLAFLIAPGAKPIPIVLQPDFIWLGTGRLLESLPVPPLSGNSPWPGIPVLFIILLIVAALVHVLMTYMDFGRAIYAIGGNATAARLAGINVNRVKVGMYALSGAIAGLAGVLLTARTTSGNPINGQGLELQAITAVFLGGAATTGGKGTIVGTVLAFILVGILNNGMNLIGINTFYQRVTLGALLIGAVAVAQWRQARAERARTKVAVQG
jgi:ribose/xylose/arabinose/galactoside ABC-type transport system permease subunit